jgi:hypothetical protein
LERLVVPFTQVVPLRFTPATHSTGSFAALQNHRIQPERYVQLGANWLKTSYHTKE